MKKLFILSIILIFAVINSAFVFNTGSEANNMYSDYKQQIKNSGECPFSKIDETKKSQCPFLESKKSECPYLKGDVKESESKSCPYSGKKRSGNSNPNPKIKTLDVKFS